MNLANYTSAALRGLRPHVPEAKIRRLQRALISQLFWHKERRSEWDSHQVRDSEWVYIVDKKGAVNMEQVAIEFETKEGKTVYFGDKFGQLALCPIAKDDWSISHITSGFAIEFIQCSRDQAEMIMQTLQAFDFDAYWAKTKHGEIDTEFVRQVKRTIESIEADI